MYDIMYTSIVVFVIQEEMRKEILNSHHKKIGYEEEMSTESNPKKFHFGRVKLIPP